MLRIIFEPVHVVQERVFIWSIYPALKGLKLPESS